MTEQEVLQFIQLAIPKDRANADAISKIALRKAILKVGRMPNVTWNRDVVTFDLISGKAKHILGDDILVQYPNIWNMEELWRTDTSHWRISILGMDDFDNYARDRKSVV